MLEWMLEGLGVKKPIWQPPARLCAMGAGLIAKRDAREGKQAGSI
jgi:hypothetical protein